tara:strand:- start:2008 stop:2325 length:318 start_codon:yes stop_codon:yes gene_type:complete
MNRLEQLKVMSAEDPNDSFIRFAIAMEYKTDENFEEAISFFEKLKELDAKYIGLYYHLAECYVEMEDEKKALTIYKEGIKLAEDQNDQHAKAELMNAKVNLEMGL